MRSFIKKAKAKFSQNFMTLRPSVIIYWLFLGHMVISNSREGKKANIVGISKRKLVLQIEIVLSNQRGQLHQGIVFINYSLRNCDNRERTHWFLKINIFIFQLIHWHYEIYILFVWSFSNKNKYIGITEKIQFLYCRTMHHMEQQLWWIRSCLCSSFPELKARTLWLHCSDNKWIRFWGVLIIITLLFM